MNRHKNIGGLFDNDLSLTLCNHTPGNIRCVETNELSVQSAVEWCEAIFFWSYFCLIKMIAGGAWIFYKYLERIFFS